MDRNQLRIDINHLYAQEHAALGLRGARGMLDAARQWDLAPVLQRRGALVFPHAGVQDCAKQISAVVNACIDSGADTVVAISVLHAFTDDMEQARRRVAAGGNPAIERIWGIQGPEFERGTEWAYDHAMFTFRYLWEVAADYYGKRMPRVIEVYPWLAGGFPQLLPGYAEVEKLTRDAVVISTADMFHHGIGYGEPVETALYPHAGGLQRAHEVISAGAAMLAAGNYAAYNQHCVDAKSDHRDAGQLMRALLGPLEPDIVDIIASDAAGLYKAADPTWVAGTLVAWHKR
ncbi:MAG: hypothetical protein RLZZ297_1647 [Chloroflexota bacterium]